MKKRLSIFSIFVCFVLLSAILAACSSSAEPTATPLSQQTTPSQSSSDGYPGSIAAYPASGPSYPVPTREGLVTEPPNPVVELPGASATTAVIGGTLIQEITGQGFIPLNPYQFILGELIYNDQGEPVLLNYSDESLRAETFDTGIFIFRNVPPGTYGLILNLAVAEFPIRDDAGQELLITVEAGDVIDLGQFFVDLP